MKWVAVRRATPGEEFRVAEMWDDASSWLASSGVDQWQYPANQDKIAADIESGKVYMAVSDFIDPRATALGTITLDTSPDPDFWQDGKSAIYVRRMISAPAARGHGLGAALLDWAAGRAAGAGRVRLDAWKTNAALHAYYTSLGFQHLRTVDLPHRRSGALFERPASDRSYRGPIVHDVAHPDVDADGRSAA